MIRKIYSKLFGVILTLLINYSITRINLLVLKTCNLSVDALAVDNCLPVNVFGHCLPHLPVQ